MIGPIFVPSSNLASFTYDATSGTLQVGFQDGKVYDHSQVPQEVFAQFMDFAQHQSYGRFYAREIKGQYATTRRTDLEQPGG